MKQKVLLVIAGLALLGVAVVSSARANDVFYETSSYECLGQVCINDRVQVTQGYYRGERGVVVSLDYYRNSATVFLDYNQYVEITLDCLLVIQRPNPYPQPYPNPNPYPNPYPQPHPRPIHCPPGTVYDAYRGACVPVYHPGPRPRPRPVPVPQPRPRPRPRPVPHPHPGPAPRPIPNPGGHCPPGTHYDYQLQRCVR